MSDGLRRTAGVPRYLNIKGENFRISPMTVGIWAECESYICSTRANVTIESAAKALGIVEEQHHKLVIATAFEHAKNVGIATMDEVITFLMTYNGTCFALWHMLRKEYGDRFKELDDVKKLVNDVPLQQLQLMMEIISETSELKNSSGLGDEDVAQANQTERQPSPGPSSIASWFSFLFPWRRKQSPS